MKIKILTFSALILLNGCANQAYQVQNSYQQAAKKEADAWAIALKRVDKECQVGTEQNPLPRSQALKKYQCWAEIVSKEVSPKAVRPSALAGLITDQKEVSIEYKKGKLDRDEANLKLQRNYISYLNSIDEIAQRDIAQAAREDAVLRQQQQQYFQTLGQEVNRVEAEQQRAMQARRPVNTTCNTVAGNLNCTTW